MSVLGALFHFTRAVIHAHNNAKVRNLMDAMPPEGRSDVGRQASPGAPEKEPGVQCTRTGGR